MIFTKEEIESIPANENNITRWGKSFCQVGDWVTDGKWAVKGVHPDAYIMNNGVDLDKIASNPKLCNVRFKEIIPPVEEKYIECGNCCGTKQCTCTCNHTHTCGECKGNGKILFEGCVGKYVYQWEDDYINTIQIAAPIAEAIIVGRNLELYASAYNEPLVAKQGEYAVAIIMPMASIL